MRMADAGDVLDLALQAFDTVPGWRDDRAHDLHRHRLVDGEVSGLVDLAHRALAQQLTELEAVLEDDAGPWPLHSFVTLAASSSPVNGVPRNTHLPRLTW